MPSHFRMQQLMALLFLLCALIAAKLSAADTLLDTYYGEWRTGRATFYGTDAWSIHKGSCNYGYLDPRGPLGWNVAAIADASPLYPLGMCGQCLEVQCRPSSFSDNYGMWLDRKDVCFNSASSMVVRITDSCPCVYDGNSYSNKRWCCGDMDNLDLSYVTFGALADMKWGVIGISYRQVPCNYVPSTPANQGPYADTSGTSPLPLRDWPEYMAGRPNPPMDVYNEYGLTNRWRDASWNTYVVPADQSNNLGITWNKPALCASVNPGGALSVILDSPGAFVNRTKLSFWVYVGEAGSYGEKATVPDITIGLSGNQGACWRPRIWYVKPQMFVPSCTYCTDYWWQFEFHLNGFTYGGDPAVPERPSDFIGCGYNKPWDVNRIEWRNDGYGGLNSKYFCLNDIKLI